MSLPRGWVVLKSLKTPLLNIKMAPYVQSYCLVFSKSSWPHLAKFNGVTLSSKNCQLFSIQFKIVFIIGFKVTNIFFLIGSTILNFLLIVRLRFNRRDGRIWGAMVDSTIFNFLFIIRFNRRGCRTWGVMGSTILNFLLIIRLHFNRIDIESLFDFTFYPIKYSFFFQITTQCMAIQGLLKK